MNIKTYCRMIIAIYVIYLGFLWAMTHDEEIKDGIKKGKKKVKKNWKMFKLRFEKVNYEVVK